MGTSCKNITKTKLGLDVSDTQCGFKGFKADVAKKIAEKMIINRWAFDAEILYIAKLNNIQVKEIPVKWENDSDSRVSPYSASLEFIKDLGKIKSNKKNYIFE